MRTFSNSRSLLAVLTGILFLFFIDMVKAQQINFTLLDALTLFENEQYEDAIPLFKEAMEVEPNNPDIPVYLVSSYIQLSRFAEAVETGNEALRSFPDEVRLYVVTGEAAFQTDLNQAIRLYEALRTLILGLPGQSAHGVSLNAVNQALSTLYEQQGSQSYRDGNVDEAIRAYRRAIRFNPDRMEFHFNLAFLLYQSGKGDEAATVLEEAIERFPTEESLRLLLVEVKSGADSTEDLVRVTRELHQQFPDNTAYALSYAVSLFNDNQPLETIRFLEEMIQKHPKERQFYDQLRDIHQMRRSLAAANDIIFRMMNAFPDDFQLKLDYGQSLWFIEEFEESFTFFKELYEEKKHPEVGRLAGNTLLLNDKTKEAFEWYSILIEDWPDHANIVRETALLAEDMQENEMAFSLFSKHALLTFHGFSMLKAAELAPDNEIRAGYLEMAQFSMFAPIANFLVIREETSLRRLSTESVAELASDMLLLSTELETTNLQEMQQRADELIPEITPRLFLSLNESNLAADLLIDLLEEIVTRFPVVQAMDILEILIEEHPQQPFLLYQHARNLQRAGNSERALEQLRFANQLGMNTVELHLLMGHLFEDKNIPMQAILSFERVLTLDKNNTRAYRNIIDVSQRAGLLNELCDRWLLRYENDSENAVLREFLIEALQKADRHQEARQLLR